MKKTTFLLNLETKKFQQEAKRADDSLKGIGNTARVEGKHIDAFSNSLKKGIAGALSVAAVTSFVKNVAVIRGEFESLGIAIETFLGSKEKADKLMAQIAKTAAITPFTMQEVSQGAQQLLAFGVEAENVDETLRQLGNVASGVNKSLGDIISPFGRIMSTGIVTTRDLMTMASQGVPVYAELAKVIGVTSEEIGKMATNGQITREHIVTMFQAMSAEGGKFYKLMEKQAVGTKGLMANLGVAIEAMQNDIGTKLQPAINGLLQGGINLAENYKEVAKVIGDLIVAYGSYRAALLLVTTIQKTATISTTLFSRALVIARRNLRALHATMMANPYGLIAAAIASVVFAIYKLATAESDADKATRRHNERQQRSLELTEQRRAKVDSLINSIQDETLANAERSGSLDELITLYPEIIQKYIDEEGKLKDILALKKEIAEFDAVQQREEQANQIKALDEKIARLEDEAKLQGGSQTGLAFVESQLRQAYKERALLEADLIAEREKEAMKEWQVSLKKMTGEQIDVEIASLNERYAESTKAERELIDKKLGILNAEIGSRMQDVKPLNYSYWEDVKKQAEDALKAMSADKVGSKEWMDLTNTILEAQSMLDKYSTTQKDVKENTREELDLKKQIASLEFDIATTGLDDRKKLLDLQMKNELSQLEDSVQDKIYTEEEYQKTVALIRAKYQLASEELDRKEKEEYEKKIEDALEEFVNSEEKIKQIRDKYSKLRIEASKREGYDIEAIALAEARAIESVLEGTTEKAIDLTNATFKQLEKELEKARKAMEEAMTPESIQDAQERIDDILSRMRDLNPIKKFGDALKEAFALFKDKDYVGGFGLLSKSFKELKPSLNQFGNDIETIFGGVGREINKAVETTDNLLTIGSGTARVLAGDLTGVLDLASGVAGLISTFKGKSKEQKDTERLQKATERIAKTNQLTNKIIEDRIKLIKEATTAELGYNKAVGDSAIKTQEALMQAEFKKLGKNDFFGKKGRNNNLRLWMLGIRSMQDLSDFWGGEKHLSYLERGYDQRNMDEWQNLVDLWDNLQEAKIELRRAEQEAWTGLGLEDAKNSLDEFLRDAEKGFDDVAKHFDDVMSDAMLNLVKKNFLNEQLENWYDSFAKEAEKGLSKESIDSLRTDYLKIYEDAQGMYDSLSDIIGVRDSIDEGTAIGQYQTLSEDTGRLLEGRANAILTNTTLIQGDINNIKSGVITLASNTLISAEKLTEMRDLALTSVGVLERIARGTDNLEPIREDIRDMKNTLRDKL